MIAANDPQEFIPGGRQQALRHPDPPELQCLTVPLEAGDDFLLHRLERVKLDENAAQEWWQLRKSVDKSKTLASEDICLIKKEQTAKNARESAKSFLFGNSKSHSEMLVEDSWTPKSFDISKKRISDITASRLFLGNQNKLFSSEFDRSEREVKPGSRTPGGNTTTTKGRIQFRSPEECMEEELYVKGNLVIWSRGLSYNVDEKARSIICCYSSYFPLVHAIWCTFQMENPDFGGEDSPEWIGEPFDCLCIADSQNLRVYTKDDENFTTMLSFQVKKLWPTKLGIFIERSDSDNQKERPIIYSLTHPLDIATPLTYSKNGATKILLSESIKIVFTSQTLDICMLYDDDLHQHFICRIRRLKLDELDTLNKSHMHPSMMHTKNITSMNSLTPGSYRGMFPMASPFNSRPTSAASNSLTRSRGQSLLTAPHYHASSRCHTPMMSPAPGVTPPITKKGAWMEPFSRLHSTVKSDSSMMNRFPNTETSRTTFIEPTFCLEHVWSETLFDDSINTPATNVFLSEDLMGQSYLCYLVSSRSQLSIVKFDYSNNSDDIVFGKAKSISAKDAVAVPHLHMLAILEHTSNVVLYSGVTVIGKLHIGGTLAQHVPSPYAVRKSSNKLYNSPFPRRSSLLPTSTPADPRFDDHMLSPVMPAASTAWQSLQAIMHIPEIGDAAKAVLIGLKDSIDSRITLQYSDGSYYRVSLPNMVNSALIEDCLNSLRIALPRDLVMATLAKWYACRNLPGNTDMSQEEEWQIFTQLIFELLGYGVINSDSKGFKSVEHTPSSAQVKRQRQSADGTLLDWNNLKRNTNLNLINEYLHFSSATVNLSGFTESRRKQNEDESLKINTSSLLFPYIRIIHYVLHLVYEDLKLNTLRKSDLSRLAKFLAQLSNDLGIEKYAMHYWKDHPSIIPIYIQKQEKISQGDLKFINKWSQIPVTPTNILEYIHNLIVTTNDRNDDDVCIKEYPVINNINTRSKNVVQLLATYLKSNEMRVEKFVSTITPPGGRKNVTDAQKTPMHAHKYVTNETNAQKVVLLMIDLEISSRDLDTYPLAVNFMLYDALWSCRKKPPTDWPPEAYNLLQRPDLAAQSVIIKNADNNESDKCDIFGEVTPKTQSVTGNDGMEDMDNDVLKLRFSTDQRVQEARNLLQSSKPVAINVIQRPDVSDHDHLEEQEKQLYAICTRTMALPVGRGMFTLHTSTPVITEPLPVPPLCLTGKALPRGTTVELTHIDTPSNMAHWPQFHNGVANGLRINPAAKHVDSTWIIFNKPKTNAETMMEHAGFLMALGLNGHLKNLAILNRFDYLSNFHEMTSVGILLGLSAAFRGTSNKAITKMLSLHVEGLLPPTSIELDVPQNLQVASLLGIGMIYQGTTHRRMIEVMLTEIGRPPGPEMENSVDRQSYSLAAGLSLGLITLRQGGQSIGLSDLKVPDTLHYYMVGGSKRPIGGTQKEKYKVPSFQIREGATVNLDVTAPGATLALGLMYLGTGNKAIAGWMSPPDTHYLLDFVRPDFLMLRTLCRSLILWGEIEPVKKWIESQVPDSIRPFCMVEPDPQVDLDYEAMNQAYCNIIAGACFAIGLKYAGSADEDVFQLLLEYCHMFACLTSKTIAELAGKPTMETCLNVVLLSVSMVMAGTGNIEIIRIVRYLRRRVGLASSAVVTYGSHLAMHMALGLLFLGGGRYTLSNSPTSIAALICAFYPKFPTHSNDNRYHLQAFRHLYVLAAEPRLVIPTDIVTGKMCYAFLNVVTLDGRTLWMKAPALIPDLNTLYKVSVQDQRYWPVDFERERNWDQLLKVLSVSGDVDVKQRAGCLSYTEDKSGFKSDLARTLTESDIIPWDPPAKSILSFSSDIIVRLFADHFLSTTKRNKSEAPTNRSFSGDEYDPDEVESASGETQMQHAFTQITYESVIQDKLAALPLFLQLIEIVRNLNSTTTSLDIWHLKIIYAFSLKPRQTSTLINNEFLIALHQKALTEIDNWEPGLWETLKAYVLRQRTLSNCENFERLAKYVAFYCIPCGLEVDTDILSMMLNLQEKHGCDSEIIDKVLRILGYVQ